MQYTLHIWGGQPGAHCSPLSFANSCGISTTPPSLPFLCQQFLAIWLHFPHTKYVLSPSLPLSTSIALGSLAGPDCSPLFWWPSLYWPPSLHVIYPPLSPYDPLLNPSLGYAFPCGHTIFLPNILSSALLCLWFLSNLTALSCHSSIVLGGLSASANFFLSTLLNSLLNSSMRGHHS